MTLKALLNVFIFTVDIEINQLK